MNKRLSKAGLILLTILNSLYVMILIRGTKPNPVTEESLVSENNRFIIIIPIILIALCVSGLFIKDKNIDGYRKCSKLLAALRVVTGEFGAFWFTFYETWQKSGVRNPLTIFTDLDKPNLYLVLGVILLLFSLPLIGHIGALLCFEYGLQKEKRTKKLCAYKVFLMCLAIIALIGFLTLCAVLYSQTLH